MRRLILLMGLLAVLFLTGCEALTMTPDAWLDFRRWDQEEVAKAQSGYFESAR